MKGLLSLPKGGVPPPAPVTVKFRPHGERYLPSVYLQNRTYELPPPFFLSLPPGVKLPPPWTNIGPGFFIIIPPFTHGKRKIRRICFVLVQFFTVFFAKKRKLGTKRYRTNCPCFSIE
jgi:hypothetical protein